mmetsp:Transcript_85626/g.247138  ORF Transcript_85626/g.247138 Transcript_85626/m.247138 type:complete len:324 (+) Transcript_85626:995-1966(+)
MHEVVRQRGEVLGVELTVGVADGEDRGRRAQAPLRHDLLQDLLRRPPRVRGLPRHLAWQPNRVEGGVAHEEVVLELSNEGRRLFLGALLPGLHGEDQADLPFRDARGGDAPDRESQDLVVLLVVRQDHEVPDLLPLRAGAELQLRVLHLGLIERMKVRVVEVGHLLRAHVAEHHDVHAHLPSLVQAEQRHERESGKDLAAAPKHDGEGHKEAAAENGEQAPTIAHRAPHVDGFQRTGVGRRGQPDAVLVDYGEHALVQAHGVGPRREQRRVQARGSGGRDDPLLRGDEAHADDADGARDDEGHYVLLRHGLPRAEEQQVLRGR